MVSTYGGGAAYEAPLQKEFYKPIIGSLWFVLALLPFKLIRGRRSFLIYCFAFCVVGGWLIYDIVVPFRYVAAGFQGEIKDYGSTYSSGTSGGGYDYLITRFDPSASESWLSLSILVWPFFLGILYHLLYARGRWNSKASQSNQEANNKGCNNKGCCGGEERTSGCAHG